MRLPSLSNGLLSLGLLSGLLTGASSCSSDYGLFDVHVEFVSNIQADRDPVEMCWLRILDESNKELLKYQIAATVNTSQEVVSGCGKAPNGSTKKVVGDISYSTSRSSGTLKFIVSAEDANRKPVKNGCTYQTIKVFHSPADEQSVKVDLDGPSDDPAGSCKAPR
jgi:hypothetical protein